MAPEVLSNSSSSYDASKADIWSFGITLIELLRGRPPLYYLSPRAAMSTIPRTSPPRLESDDPGASKILKKLIHSCLHDDPKKRPSASQLLKSFKGYFKNQSTFMGSLASLQKPKTAESEDKIDQISTMKMSETIYSQWDFDLSTFKDEQFEEEAEEESIGLISIKPSTVVSETVIEEIIQPLSPVKSPLNACETPIITFRKLERPKNKQKGWKDKDLSILPIPCPSDAPDLTRPYQF